MPRWTRSAVTLLLEILTDVSFQGLSAGLRAAKEIAERLDLDGYYGPLYSLFKVDDRYKTSVEAVAGTR